MMSDGPKRRGRFIKKDSFVSQHVIMQSFSFEEIAPGSVIVPDNTSRSIIHAAYHDADFVESVAKTPDRFDENLVSSSDSRGVLFPLDFTEDWERSKNMQRANVEQHDDDFDFEEVMRRARHKVEKARVQQNEGTPGATESVTSQALRSDSEEKESAASAAKADDAVAVMRAAGFRFAPSDPVVENKTSESAELHSDSQQNLEKAGDVDMVPSRAESEDRKVEQQTDFIPISSNEVEASDEYRRRIAAREQEERDRERLEEEAKARGYREGFRIGEEKGATVARQNAGLLLGKMAEVINELSGLKKLILESVQDNFYEICQAMAEALFKREFSIRPETFTAVVRRAIDEAVEPGKIKVHLHPDTFDRVVALGVTDLIPFLVKDSAVEVADFKIESEQSVIDANLSKIVADFLTQADLSLIEENDTQMVTAKQDAG